MTPSTPLRLVVRRFRSLDEYGEASSVAGYPVYVTEGQGEPLDVQVRVPLDFKPRTKDPREAG